MGKVYGTISFHFYLQVSSNSFFFFAPMETLDIAVGIVTGYRLDNRGVKNFLFSTLSRPVLGPTQCPFQWVLGTLSGSKVAR
jgi:hypothetical protein